MKCPKFIIQNGFLILGYVEFHHELKQNESPVNGGGWFNIKNQNLTFWKDSHDFGKPKAEDIKKCIDLGKVLGDIDIDNYNIIINV